jgi:hypothetical protein
VKELTRRDFFNVCKKENLKQAFEVFHSFKEGEEAGLRRSCDEAAELFFKKRLHKTKQ